MHLGKHTQCLGVRFSVSGMTLSPKCSALCLRGNAHLSSSCFDENLLTTKKYKGMFDFSKITCNPRVLLLLFDSFIRVH